MRKILFSLILITSVLFQSFSSGDEGMWLPLYIKKLNEGKMQQLGCRLTAEDIYNINKSSVKDAVLRLGEGFCTGEIVSDKGLVFTNHHCGYESIAELSSVDNDFLTNGFWAKNMKDEIPIPKLTVSRLVYMEDLTQQVKSRENTSGFNFQDFADSVVAKATEGTHYDAEVKDYFGETEYYLLVYETFKDIRFVGAPPSSIGKFGGDTDNWMWPRHTGDFSILRIYTGADGKPAEYNENNIPYKPIHYFPISLKGLKNNDFAMIMGYPGTTERYLSSYDIEFKMNYEQPAIIDIFSTILKEMKVVMDKNDKVRLALASDYASMANTWKYFEGQLLGLKNYNLIEKYKEKDAKIQTWINEDVARYDKYSTVLKDLEIAYNKYKKIMPGLYYMGFGVLRLDAFGYAVPFNDVKKALTEGTPVSEVLGDIQELWKEFEKMEQNLAIEMDKVLLPQLMIMFYNSLKDPSSFVIFKEISEKYKSGTPEEKIRMYCNDLYATSVIFNREKLTKFKSKPSAKALKNEMIFHLYDELIGFYRDNYMMTYMSMNMMLQNYQNAYIEMTKDYLKDKTLYPDANSTLRLTYGQVLSYRPKDAVFYKYYSTHHGILEKEDPKKEEFVVDSKLKELLINKDFGQYGVNDTLYVCFLTNNDITGGNSGSPVLNADGHLIGIAFDGNWEAMTGDLVVNPDLNRTISVDIRYVLFVIEKFAGATNLIQELKIIK